MPSFGLCPSQCRRAAFAAARANSTATSLCAVLDAMSANFREQGIAIVKRAVEMDHAERYAVGGSSHLVSRVSGMLWSCLSKLFDALFHSLVTIHTSAHASFDWPPYTQRFFLVAFVAAREITML